MTVHGATGSPVVLLAGGAASSHGFFPGLVEALEGHRVVELDRPGTGLAKGDGPARLASGSAAVASVVRDLGEPAVVVGQSLGGLVALQFAADHPELLAGLVLLEPTPVDMPELVPLLTRVLAVLSLPGRLPGVGRRLDLLVWRLLGLRFRTAPEARASREAMFRSATVADTARAITTLGEEMRSLAPTVRGLAVPSVLVTADRRPGHRVRQSHERLAAALGARVVAPAGAVHADHFRAPQGFNDLVVSLVVAADAATPTGSPT